MSKDSEATACRPKHASSPKHVDMAEMLKGIKHIVDASKIFGNIDSNVAKGLMETADNLFKVAEQIQETGVYMNWMQKRTDEGEAGNEYKAKIDEIEAELLGDS
jgi:hypothetical protein